LDLGGDVADDRGVLRDEGVVLEAVANLSFALSALEFLI